MQLKKTKLPDVAKFLDFGQILPGSGLTSYGEWGMINVSPYKIVEEEKYLHFNYKTITLYIWDENYVGNVITIN